MTAVGRWVAPAILALLFLVLKLWAVRPVIGDEGIYFYLGQRAADGLIPYRDFVFSHPPLHIYSLALLSWIGGGSFAVVKFAPSVFTLLSGCVLFLIGRREPLAGAFLSRSWALVPPALFLLCYDTLRVSSHATGVNQALMFLLVGLWAHAGRRSRIAGVAFAGSLATASYVAPLIGLIGLISFPWRQRARRDGEGRRFVELGAWAAGSFALIHLPVWLVAPGAWWAQTIRFHIDKPAIGSTFDAAFHQLMTAEGFLVVASLVFLVWWAVDGQRKWELMLPAVGLGYLAFLSLFERVYVYYLTLSLPFLSLGAGILLSRVWWVMSSASVRRRVAAAGLLLATLVVQPWYYRRIPEVARNPGAERIYEFQPTPGMGPVNALVGAVFPSRRVVGFPAPGLLRYLWHENGWWQEARSLAEEIAETLPPDGTLYGDSTTTPILALLSGRRVACDLADTNTMQFRTGLRSLDADLDCARDDGLRLIVVQPRRGLDRLDEFRNFHGTEGVVWRESIAGSRRVRLLTWEPPTSVP